MIKNIYFTVLNHVVWLSSFFGFVYFLLYGAFEFGLWQQWPISVFVTSSGISWVVAELCKDMFRLIIGGINDGM